MCECLLTRPEDAKNIYVDMIKSFDPLPVSTEYLEGTVAMEKIENPIGSVNGLSNINGLSLATTETDEQLQVTGTFTSTIRVKFIFLILTIGYIFINLDIDITL